MKTFQCNLARGNKIIALLSCIILYKVSDLTEGSVYESCNLNKPFSGDICRSTHSSCSQHIQLIIALISQTSNTAGNKRSHLTNVHIILIKYSKSIIEDVILPKKDYKAYFTK